MSGRGQCAPARQRGMTLVELMVALVLGLLIVGGALTALLGNRQTHRVNDNLARVQESARMAFELMARDIREAGGTGCAREVPTVSVLNPAQGGAPAWWAVPNGILGFDGDTAFPAAPFGAGQGQRIPGTSAIILHGAQNTGVSVVNHNANAAQFRVSQRNGVSGIVPNAVLMVCDYQQASIFQATNANAESRTIVHNVGAGTIGNCSQGLGYSNPANCTNPRGTPKVYGINSMIFNFSAKAWYIGVSRTGSSLFSIALNGNPVEVAPGVQNMQITYLDNTNAYQNAAAIANWDNVGAASVALTLRANQDQNVTQASPERVDRTLTHTIALRNRLP